MNENIPSEEVAAIKDETSERPIPTAWRPAFCEVVNAFVNGDYLLENGVVGVGPVSKKTSSHIQSYLRAYGATLRTLPNETWKSSVCIWMGTHWDALVDLYTNEDGPSDLVLSAQVWDTNPGFKIHIDMVYVP